MKILSQGTGHLIQLVTDAAGDIEPSVDYVDKTGSGPSYNFAGAGDPLASITSATTTTILAGAASTERAIRRLSFFNNHASQAVTCTVQETDGTHTSVLAKCILAAGESLVMDAAGVWTHYDAAQGQYVGSGPFATQAEMEAASILTKVVSPGRLHNHPGVCKFWAQVTGGGTPSLTTNYNVTSIADTGTGRMTVTIALDFSSANWCANLTTFTTTTGTAEGISNINAKAAGTIECGNRIITPAAGDPNVGYDVIGYGDQ